MPAETENPASPADAGDAFAFGSLGRLAPSWWVDEGQTQEQLEAADP